MFGSEQNGSRLIISKMQRGKNNTVVQPDLSILYASTSKDYVDFPPVLVVDILSPSTREKDLITKRELYAKFGIKYYLIIDPQNDSISTLELHEDQYIDSKITEFELAPDCQISPDFSEAFR